MQFKNTADIQKYYQEQIKKNNVSALKEIKTNTGKPIQIITDDILRSEAERLKECINSRLIDYYDSDSPKMYERTYGLRDSLTVDTQIYTNTHGKRCIGMFFDESRATGHSVFGGNDEWKPKLINDGWQVENGWHKNIPRFGFQEGYHFKEKGIEDWKSSLKYDIDVVRTNRSI